ncbi:MAG TPA: hypothetical protein DCL08_06700 [Anaerolineaceae bacterium]|nr:MAG: Xre family DNA-binding protein [Anaerolineaceae bacterium 46_22]HAF48914.1 hypothetical protein [Anaerolineaceae bacterium]
MSQTPGQKLKQIRESLGISLEEIAQKTRIRMNYLEAIEVDDDESLPSRVHKRGFLRLYAAELGINLEDLQIKPNYQGTASETSKTLGDLSASEDEEPLYKNEIEQSFDSDDEVTTEKVISQGTKEASHLKRKSRETNIPNFESLVQPETKKTEHATAIFKAIGAKLQARRRLLSLSYEDLANHLHIRQPFLEALDAGDFEALPSPVQARGMLANYAEFLNLDVDAILLEYADGLQIKRLEKQSQEESQNKKTAKELSPTGLRLKNFFSLDLLVIAGLLLGFAGFLIWGVNRIMNTENPNIEATDIPEVADVLLATGSPTPQITMTMDSDQVDEEIVETSEIEPTPIFTPLPGNNQINIVIIPRQRTWVQITTDGQIAFEGRLISGNVYDFSGDDSVEVLTGNAGALQIYFNDQDMGSPGLLGQVISLVFTESGLVLPTPTNTPTITETPRPSPSPTATPTPTQTRMPTLTPTE